MLLLRLCGFNIFIFYFFIVTGISNIRIVNSQKATRKQYYSHCIYILEIRRRRMNMKYLIQIVNPIMLIYSVNQVFHLPKIMQTLKTCLF